MAQLTLEYMKSCSKHHFNNAQETTTEEGRKDGQKESDMNSHLVTQQHCLCIKAQLTELP
jgi:hypothetical protein